MMIENTETKIFTVAQCRAMGISPAWAGRPIHALRFVTIRKNC